MICPKCKKVIDNDSLFCEYCGEKIISKESSNETSQPKNKKGLWITLVLVALVILVGGGLYMYKVHQEGLRVEGLRLEEERRIAAERQAELEAQLEAERKTRAEADKKAKAEADRKAQTEARKNAEEEDDKIYIRVEKMPEFPSGNEELSKFSVRNIKYPLLAQENGIQGRVICQFIVNADGRIENIEVVRGVEESLDQEAIRVLKLMPNWIPGSQGGENVRVKYTLPIRFSL